MNQKRSWPGRAEQVQDQVVAEGDAAEVHGHGGRRLVAPEPVSSTPSLTLVIAASVVSGAISEIEPTKVVLPTPNPPATTILTGRAPGAGAGAGVRVPGDHRAPFPGA